MEDTGTHVNPGNYCAGPHDTNIQVSCSQVVQFSANLLHDFSHSCSSEAIGIAQKPPHHLWFKTVCDIPKISIHGSNSFNVCVWIYSAVYHEILACVYHEILACEKIWRI